MAKKLIALYSPIMQSGKSTVARQVTEALFGVTISFADPMREAIVAVVAPFFEGGADEARSWFLDERKDHKPVPHLGVTLRYLLITLGTSWGRELVHRDLWTMQTAWRAERHLKSYSTIIDDLRFPNEYDMLVQKGATLVKIIRPDSKASISLGEGQLNDRDFHHTIINDGSMADLAGKVGALVREMQAAPEDLSAYQ